MKTTVALDVECYPNYFLVVCRTMCNKLFHVELNNGQLVGSKGQLKAILRNHRIITFNGNGYDLPMVGAFLSGMDNSGLKKLSDAIVTSGEPWWRMSQRWPGVVAPRCDHIDLMGVTPLRASLKTYACRIHADTIQDLPYSPSEPLTDEQIDVVRDYCINDVDTTLLLYRHMGEQLKLRADMEYGDMRSMSDPQIAEAAIRQYLTEHGVYVSRREDEVEPFRYNVPDWMSFRSDTLSEALATVRRVTFSVDSNGYAQMPAELDVAVEFGGARYKLGIGGLHSQEKKQVVVPGPDEVYGEFDVASMYPSIILAQGLYPGHIGPELCDVYREIYDERLTAKHTGNKTKSDTLKIVLNASYGKFGSRYSFLYSPELLVQVTLTGQLALLMLVERLTAIGCVVKSANTDGVNVLIARDLWEQALKVKAGWEATTGMMLEWTPYKAQYSRDVNSYVAITEDGKVKSKGAYEFGSIRKGYSAQVCTNAVIAYLRDGTPLKTSIIQDGDVRDFLTMRGVRGGAVWRGQPLGKVVRWYVSKNGEPIRYMSNGNKVAGSDGAVPMMTLGEMPDDINYRWYLERAIKLLEDLGVEYETD